MTTSPCSFPKFALFPQESRTSSSPSQPLSFLLASFPSATDRLLNLKTTSTIPTRQSPAFYTHASDPENPRSEGGSSSLASGSSIHKTSPPDESEIIRTWLDPRHDIVALSPSQDLNIRVVMTAFDLTTNRHDQRRVRNVMMGLGDFINHIQGYYATDAVHKAIRRTLPRGKESVVREGR